MEQLTFDPEKLSTYRRSELQSFCKACGIKANGKNAHLVEQLQNYANSVSKDTYLSEDEEIVISEHIAVEMTKTELTNSNNLFCSPSPRRDTFAIKQVIQMEVQEEVKTGKKEIACKIPVANIKEKRVTKATPNKNWAKIHQKSFSRMDSIDDYVKRINKRAQGSQNIASLAQVTAQKAKEAMNLMKKAHNTPKEVAREKTKRRDQNSRVPVPQFAKNCISIKSPLASGRHSVITKPKSAQKTAEKTKRHTTVGADLTKKRSTLKKDTIPTKERNTCRSTLFSPKPVRASFASPAARDRVSFADFRSPTSKVTPGKTPKKFDLEASLKKKPSYKPHIGKLKPLGENYMNVNKVSREIKIRTDVKASRKATTRDERRKQLEDKRKSTRHAALAARRGVAA